MKICSLLFVVFIVYVRFSFAEANSKSNEATQLEFVAQLRPFLFDQPEIDVQKDWIRSGFQLLDQYLTSDAEDDSLDSNKKIFEFLDKVSARNTDSEIRIAVSQVFKGFLLLSVNPQQACDQFHKTLKFSQTNDHILLTAKTNVGLAWCSNLLKDYNKSSQYLKTALRLPLAGFKNQEIDIYLSMGWIEFFNRKSKKSCDAFQKARDLSADLLHQKILIHQGISLCHKSQKKYEAALTEIDEAIALLPLTKFKRRSVSLQMTRGWIFLDKRQPELSCEMFQRARNLSPVSVEQKMTIHKGFASCYKAQKNYDKALAEIDQALKISSFELKDQAFELQKIKAFIYLDKQEPEKSCENFQKALVLSPVSIGKKIAVYQGLVNCYRAQKKYEKALGEIDNALKLSLVNYKYHSIELRMSRGWIYLKMQDYGKSCETFQEARELLPVLLDQRFALHKGFANCYRGQKKYEKANLEIEEALKLPLANFKEHSIDLKIAQAWILLDKQQSEKSCELFQKARDLSPVSIDQKFDIHQGLVNCYRAQKQYDRALIEIDEALKVPLIDYKDQSIDLKIMSGWIYLDKQEPEKSCKFFQQARDLSPISIRQQTVVHQGFANCFKSQKKYEKAIAEIDEALKLPLVDLMDHSIDLQILKAWIYSTQQEPEKSCEILHRARTIASISIGQKIEIHQGLVNCYRAQKKYEKAHAEIDQALKLPATEFNSQLSNLLTIKGHIYALQRRHDISGKVLQRALNMAKEDLQKVQIYSELAQLYRKIDVVQSLMYYKKILSIVEKGSDDFKKFSRQYFTLNLKRELKKRLDVEELKSLLIEVDNHSNMDEELLLNHQVQLLFSRAYQTIEAQAKDGQSNPSKVIESLRANSVFSNFFWAGFYFYKEDFSESKKLYRKVLSLSKDSPAGYGGLENIALLESDYLDLLSFYSKAKRTVGSRWYRFLQWPLSEAYSKVMATRDPDRIALQVKLIAPTIVEYNNVLFSALGSMYLKNNRLDDAEKAFERARNDEGSTANAHPNWPYLGLAVIAIQRGNFELSANYSKRALELSNNEVRDLERLAEAYAKVDIKKSKEFYKQVVSAHLNQMKWGDGYGDESFDDGDNPYGLSNAYLQIANLEVAQGNFINAKANFNRVLKLGIEKHKAIAIEKMRVLYPSNMNLLVRKP